MRWGVPHERLTDEQQLDELTARGAWDWIQAGDIFDIARFSGHTDEDAYVEQAIHLASLLLDRGYGVAGDIVDGRHRPWAARAPEAATRIAAEWRRDHSAAPGYFVWFDPTLEGIARGEQVVMREEGLTEWISPARKAYERRAGQPPPAEPPPG